MSASPITLPVISASYISHDISLENLSSLEVIPPGLPSLQIEERPLPIYLSERSRPPFSVIRRDSESSMPNDTFRLEHINANISTVSGSGPEDISTGHRAYPDKSAKFAHVPLLPELPTPNLLSTRQKWNGTVQFLALCWSIWLEGWNDGSTGPLLPRIQQNYGVLNPFFVLFVLCNFLRVILQKVGFSIVSMVFIANCVVSLPT